MPPSGSIERRRDTPVAVLSPVPGQRIVLTTVSSDSHTWNLVFLQMLLEENGYQVVNLGPCVPDDLLLSAVREERPLAVIISSVNGHGYRDGLRVVQAIRRDPGTGTVPIVMGGKLGIRGSEDLSYARELLAAGCDAVFTDAGEAHALPTLLARIGALAAAGGAP